VAKDSIQTRRLLAESIAVVASILLAFAIDASWDDYREGIEERALLDGLRQEFERNLEDVDTQSARVEIARERLRRFPQLETLSGGAIEADSAYEVLVQPLIRSYTSEVSDGFLSATISSGKLALIDDVELRALLAETKSIDQDVSEMRQVVMDLSVNAATALGRYPELASLMDAETRPHTDPVTAWRATSDEEVLALVNAKRLYMGFYASQLGRLRGHFDAIIAAIDRALSRR